MCKAQAFVVLFFLGLILPKAKGNCDFIETQKHCVCTLLEKSERLNYIQCLPATTYELQGGNLEEFAIFSDFRPGPDIIDILMHLPVRKLIFTDLVIPEVLLPAAMEFVSYTRTVSELEFVNCTFLKAASWDRTKRLSLPVSSLRFHKVTAAPLTDTLDTSVLSGWLENLKDMSVTESLVTSIPCKIGKVFRALHFLDVSGNHFRDESIKSSFCKGAFPQLRVLKLHRNNLTSYDTVCKTISYLNMLTHLDLSQNHFSQGLSSSYAWPQSLHTFNLSNTGLQYMDSTLPHTLELLDLSSNKIFTLDLSLPSLKELHLSNNRLQAVPPLSKLPHLEVLHLDRNQISQLRSQSLLHLKHLRSLKAGHNLYNCSCSYIKDIQDLATKPSFLPDWPQDYMCKSPPQFEDILVKDVPFSSLQKCNKAPVRYGSSIVLLTACLHLVLYLFLM